MLLRKGDLSSSRSEAGTHNVDIPTASVSGEAPLAMSDNERIIMAGTPPTPPHTHVGRVPVGRKEDRDKVRLGPKTLTHRAQLTVPARPELNLSDDRAPSDFMSRSPYL